MSHHTCVVLSVSAEFHQFYNHLTESDLDTLHNKAPTYRETVRCQTFHRKFTVISWQQLGQATTVYLQYMYCFKIVIYFTVNRHSFLLYYLNLVIK